MPSTSTRKMWCDRPPSRRSACTARPTHDGTRPSRSARDGTPAMAPGPSQYAGSVPLRARIRRDQPPVVGKSFIPEVPGRQGLEVSVQTFSLVLGWCRTWPVSIDLGASARAVIVGGGVAGCSVAYHLARLGWTDIVLVEQHGLTDGTT